MRFPCAHHASGSAYAAAVQSEMIDLRLTAEVRGAGVGKVFAWTVNEPARIRRGLAPTLTTH